MIIKVTAVVPIIDIYGLSYSKTYVLLTCNDDGIFFLLLIKGLKDITIIRP
jgi:hypothetical protein